MVLFEQEYIFSYHPSSCRAAVKRSLKKIAEGGYDRVEPVPHGETFVLLLLYISITTYRY